ncbi:MAG TPA: MATE family efflux transporter, partial [Candidatus Pelethocola excrementipullorum]|nr:MATE family efflux transporter [Candidatus Pelethocola excrementipullorum]
IFTFDMGIAGAAVATILAQIIVAVLFLVSMKVVKDRPFEKFDIIIKPDSMVIKQIFAWSIPIALESMFFTILSMIISRFVAAFGTSAMAAQRVGSQVESLSWLIGGGFASAVTAFMGQNFGANKWKRIHKGYRISSLTMLIWGGFITFVLLLGGQALIGAFLSEPEAVKMGASYLNILAACQIVACLEYNSAGAFRGIGKTIPPSLVSIASNAMRIPLIYVLSNTSLGLDGIWWGITLGSVVRSLWMLGWYVTMARKMPKEDVV